MMRSRALALALSALLICPAHALDSGAEQAATLQADDFSLDLGSGARIYRGNVSFRRGGLGFDCDSLALYSDARGEMDKGVCSGSPGRFRQRPQGGGEDLLGSARRITFDARAAEVILEGGAELLQSGKRLRGARITYDLEEKAVRAGGESGGGGARMRIPPRSEAGG